MYFVLVYKTPVAGIAQSVLRLATGWTVQGSNSGGASISAPFQTGSGVHTTPNTMGTGSFPGVKRPGRGVDHPTPSGVEVEGRVELYFCSPSGFVACSRLNFLQDNTFKYFRLLHDCLTNHLTSFWYFWYFKNTTVLNQMNENLDTKRVLRSQK